DVYATVISLRGDAVEEILRPGDSSVPSPLTPRAEAPSMCTRLHLAYANRTAHKETHDGGSRQGIRPSEVRDLLALNGPQGRVVRDDLGGRRPRPRAGAALRPVRARVRRVHHSRPRRPPRHQERAAGDRG